MCHRVGHDRRAHIRGNPDFFRDDNGVVHPIRGTSGYEETTRIIPTAMGIKAARKMVDFADSHPTKMADILSFSGTEGQPSVQRAKNGYLIAWKDGDGEYVTRTANSKSGAIVIVNRLFGKVRSKKPDGYRRDVEDYIR